MAATAVATIEAARNIAAVERNCLPPPSFRRQMRTILADGEAFCVAPHLTQVQRHQMAFAARQTSEHACRDGHSMRQQTSRAAQMRARRRGDACGRAGGRKRGRGYSFLYTYSPPSGAYPLNSGKKAIRWPQNPSNPQWDMHTRTSNEILPLFLLLLNVCLYSTGTYICIMYNIINYILQLHTTGIKYIILYYIIILPRYELVQK